MYETATAPRLIDTPTHWTLIHRAHQGPPETMREARQRLLELYCRPVYRYLLGALRDEEAASDLANDFAVRFLEGSFHRANPGNGRFRDYVRISLSRLVTRYRHKQRSPFQPLPADVAAPADPLTDLELAEAGFLASCREQLIRRALAALKRIEEETGRLVHFVFRLDDDHPGLSAAQLAKLLTQKRGQPVTPEGARKALERARRLFRQLLEAEVAQTLEDPTPECVTEELIHLGLMEWCRKCVEGR